MGLQKIAVYIAFVCYYMIGIPFASILAFWFKLGAISFLGGITIATTVQWICYALLLLKTDW